MAKDLSTKDRKKLSKKSFALPGKRKYPIPDKAHAHALARVAQHGTPAEQKKVKAAVKKRFPSIGKKEEQEILIGGGGSAASGLSRSAVPPAADRITAVPVADR